MELYVIIRMQAVHQLIKAYSFINFVFSYSDSDFLP